MSEVTQLTLVLSLLTPFGGACGIECSGNN